MTSREGWTALRSALDYAGCFRCRWRSGGRHPGMDRAKRDGQGICASAHGTARPSEENVTSVPVVGIVIEGNLIRRPEPGTERHRSWWLELATTSDDLAPDYVKAYRRRAVNRGRGGGDDAQ